MLKTIQMWVNCLLVKNTWYYNCVQKSLKEKLPKNVNMHV